MMARNSSARPVFPHRRNPPDWPAWPALLRSRRSVPAPSGVVLMVMESSLVNGATINAQVENREYQGDQHQDVAHGRAFAELEVLEGQGVGLGGDGLRGVGGPAVC